MVTVVRTSPLAVEAYGLALLERGDIERGARVLKLAWNDAAWAEYAGRLAACGRDDDARQILQQIERRTSPETQAAA